MATVESAFQAYHLKLESEKLADIAYRTAEINERQRSLELYQRQSESDAIRKRDQLQKRNLLLLEEDGAWKIFEAICKNLETQPFSSQILNDIVDHGESALVLAQFGTEKFCKTPENFDHLIATGHDIKDSILNDWKRFYYTVGSGPFKGWCLRPVYKRNGLNDSYVTYTLQKVSYFWQLLGY